MIKGDQKYRGRLLVCMCLNWIGRMQQHSGMNSGNGKIIGRPNSTSIPKSAQSALPLTGKSSFVVGWAAVS
jgi:hypothetical protein